MTSEVETDTALAFGDVILVSFPFTNQVATKRRPAVVISGRSYNRSKPDVVVVAITSQMRANQGLGEVSLRAWQSAGLVKPSAVKPVIATLERGLMIRRLGVLSGEDQVALRRALAEVLG